MPAAVVVCAFFIQYNERQCAMCWRAYGDKSQCIENGRVDYILPADYSENSELDETVSKIIRKIAITDCLIRKSNAQLASIKRAK